MKKFLFLGLIFSAIFSTTTNAQTGSTASAQAGATSAQAGGNMAAMLQQVKEKVRPQMVEKTGLTEAQADKVIEINFEIRQAAVGLRDLSEADRTQKLADLKASKEKKYSEIPLTAEQIKAVYAFYEGMGKSMPQKN
jgi:hypothetical protein